MGDKHDDKMNELLARWAANAPCIGIHMDLPPGYAEAKAAYDDMVRTEFATALRAASAEGAAEERAACAGVALTAGCSCSARGREGYAHVIYCPVTIAAAIRARSAAQP